jgi:hypothetical protein
MKKLFSLFLSLFIYADFVYCQTSVSIGNDLKGLMATGGSVGNTVVSSFNSPGIKGKRYVFDTWTPGTIISADGNIYSSKYSFNLDKINQDLYAVADSNYNSVFILDRSRIKRFNAGNLSFINSINLHGNVPGYFYQILVDDSTKFSLYKLTTTKFVKANPNDIMNARTGNVENEYIDDVKYFISVSNGDLKKINLNESNIRKTLKANGEKVDNYFSTNSFKSVDEAFLVDLIQSLNK